MYPGYVESAVARQANFSRRQTGNDSSHQAFGRMQHATVTSREEALARIRADRTLATAVGRLFVDSMLGFLAKANRSSVASMMRVRTFTAVVRSAHRASRSGGASQNLRRGGSDARSTP